MDEVKPRRIVALPKTYGKVALAQVKIFKIH